MENAELTERFPISENEWLIQHFNGIRRLVKLTVNKGFLLNLQLKTTTAKRNNEREEVKSVFSISDLVLVFMKNIYDARETAFHHISLHLEFSRTEKKKKAKRRRRVTLSSPFSEFGKPVKRSLSDTSLQNFSWC